MDFFADGYIRERKSGDSLGLKVAIKDKSHLELFKKHIKSEHEIIPYTSKIKYKGGWSISKGVQLAIYSNQLVESIKKQGVVSRKTFIIKKPNIKPSLLHHFIRGFFDGDGSITFKLSPEKDSHTYTYRLGIVCHSNLFMAFLKETLRNANIYTYIDKRKQMHIWRKDGIVGFYKYIYSGASIFLKRKNIIFEKFIKHYGFNIA